MAEEKKTTKTPESESGTTGRQTDLAEGELDTVEESIRIHEQKGDLKKKGAGGK